MKLMAILFMAAAALAGCSSQRKFGAYDKSTHTWKTSEGIMVEDRVSRNLIDPDTAIKREYLGDTYYFENDFNVGVFEQDPQSYSYRGYQPSRP